MSFVLVKNNVQTITTLTNIFFGSIPRPHKLKSRRIKNAKKITFYQWKSFAFQTIAFFCDVTFIILITVYAELSDWIIEQDQVWFISDSIIISACCSTIFHLMSYIDDVRIQNLTEDSDQQKHSPIFHIIYCFLKAILLIVHPSEYFANIQLGNVLFTHLNKAISIICYFRLIFVYGYLSKISRYYGTRISRLLSVYGYRSKATNMVYAIKCLFKQKGMIANSCLLLFTITFLGPIGMLISGQQSIISEIYYLIQTMATIGYGQFAIQSSLYKFIIVLAIISGSFAASVFKIDLLQYLELQDKELKAYRLIKRLQYQDLIYISKRKTIQQLFKQTSIWKQYEKQLEIDKSPMLEFLNIRYTYFCNSLKILLERQLLSNTLLTFYFNRRTNYEDIKEKQLKTDRGRPNIKRRVQDSYKLYQIKEKILGYKN